MTGIGICEIIEYTPKAIKKTESILQDTGSDGVKITLLTDGLEFDWSIAAKGSEPKIIWKDEKLYNEYIEIIQNAMNGNLVFFESFREKFCRGEALLHKPSLGRLFSNIISK